MTVTVIEAIEMVRAALKALEEAAISNPEPILYFSPIYLKRVSTLGLSARTLKCLQNDFIIYIGDLVQCSEAKLLRTPNFGRKSLKEVITTLGALGVQYPIGSADGLLLGWPPPNVEALERYYQDYLTTGNQSVPDVVES
jgi:DNA-directed RNA polymerase subunit alpha